MRLLSLNRFRHIEQPVQLFAGVAPVRRKTDRYKRYNPPLGYLG